MIDLDSLPYPYPVRLRYIELLEPLVYPQPNLMNIVAYRILLTQYDWYFIQILQQI